MPTSYRWPASLPQSLPLDTRRAYQQNWIETQTDVGPKIRRRRFTAVGQLLSPPTERWVFREIERIEFWRFYDVTLSSGTSTFMWMSPLADLGDVECRFSSVPEEQVIIPGAGETRAWAITMQIEVLP